MRFFRPRNLFLLVISVINAVSWPTLALSDEDLQGNFDDSIRHVLVTGQSLANGGQGHPPIGPVLPNPTKGLHWDGFDFVEKTQGFNTTKPSVSLVHNLANRTDNTWSINTVAQGAASYNILKKGTNSYNSLIATVSEAYNHASIKGKSFSVEALVVLHGSKDRFETEYSDWLQQWRDDYEFDTQEITKSSEKLPLFLTQLSRTRRLFPVHQEQLEAHVVDPNIFLVGPLYPYPKADSVHLTSEGYYFLGELLSRAIHRVLFENENWEPLRPEWVMASGNVVDIRFHVPVGGIQFDTQTIDEFPNFGLDIVDTPAEILHVEIVSENTVRITLDETPGQLAKIQYVQGNIRDGENAVSELDGSPLPNWSVAFELSVLQGDYFPVDSPILGPEINLIGLENQIYNDSAVPDVLNNTDFGPVSLSNGIIYHSLTIQNTGTENLLLTGSPIIEVSGPHANDFVISKQPSTYLKGGDSTTFEIAFDPLGIGERFAVVSILNNDEDESSFTFSVKGNGQFDTDNDSVPDTIDLDDDGDGQSDMDESSCGSDPLDVFSTAPDMDVDGIPDCVDGDNDNDGQSDADELACGSDPFDNANVALDEDGDSVPDCVDVSDYNVQVVYVSTSTAGDVDGIVFSDDDILGYDQAEGSWSMVFDGSDVGFNSNDLESFFLLDEGHRLPSILMSFANDQMITELGAVSRNDIVKFTPTSLGDDTSGSFSYYLVGSSVGLNLSGERIDAIGFDPIGRLVISTTGSLRVPGKAGFDVIARDEDMIALDGAGWSFYFDGSEVGLTTNNEDVWGTWIAENGDIYLTVQKDFSVTGLEGDGEDIFICSPVSLGLNSTSCTFSSFWRGEDHKFNEVIDGFVLGPPISNTHVPAVISARAKDTTVQLDASGTATIVPADIDDGSEVIPGPTVLNIDRGTFGCSDVGLNTVTLNVSDGVDMSESVTAKVLVEDNVAPVAIARDVTLNINGVSQVSVDTDLVDNGSSDACGIASMSLDKERFTAAGTYPVVLSVVDDNGNVALTNATVTVVDVAPPVAVAKDVTVQLDAEGIGSIVAADADNGSQVYIGDPILEVSQYTFDCDDLPVANVILTIEDESGMTATDDFIVNVEDNIDPVAVVQNLSIQLDSNGSALITAEQINDGSSDACGVGALSLDKTEFASFDLGDNTVILTVYDDHGNSDSAAAVVTVSEYSDSKSPSIYVSTSIDGLAAGINFNKDDILVYDTGNETWAVYFDAEDVGLSNLNAFELVDEGNPLPSILMSVLVDQIVPGFGFVSRNDIVKFTPTRLGDTTEGDFSFYLSGASVGLNSAGETISAIGFASDGRLLISVDGNFNALGVTGRDEDLFALNEDDTWSVYFDGSDVKLTGGVEEMWGVSVHPVNGQILFTTKGSFSVPGLSGGGADIVACEAIAVGTTTDCIFSPLWVRAASDFNTGSIDGMSFMH